MIQKAIYKKNKLQQTNTSAYQVQYKSKIREGSPNGTRKTIEEMICEKDEKADRVVAWRRHGSIDGLSSGCVVSPLSSSLCR